MSVEEIRSRDEMLTDGRYKADVDVPNCPATMPKDR